MGLVGPITQEILDCNKILEENNEQIERLKRINQAVLEKKVRAVQNIVYPQFNWGAIRKYLQDEDPAAERSYNEFMHAFAFFFNDVVTLIDVKPVGMTPFGHMIEFKALDRMFYLFYPDCKKATLQNIEDLSDGKLTLWKISDIIQESECIVSSHEFMDILQGFYEYQETLL